jgi:hypothetical protein
MVLHEWIEEHKVHIANIVRARRGCDELADDLAGVFNDCHRIINEASVLHRRIRELEEELLTFRPAPVVEHQEYGQHIRWTGD